MSVGIVINSCYCEYMLPSDVLKTYLRDYLFTNGHHFTTNNNAIATPFNFDHNIISRSDPLLVPIVEEYVKHRVDKELHKVSSAIMFDIAIIPEFMLEYYEIINNNGKEHIVLFGEKYKNETFKKIMERTDINNNEKIRLAIELRSKSIPSVQSFIEICENIKRCQQQNC